MERVGSDGGDGLRCSFCAKAAVHVKNLIAGSGAYICDECVELCVDIVSDDDLATAWGPGRDAVPVPRPELTGVVRVLDQAVGAIGSTNLAVADEARRLAARLHVRLQERASPHVDPPAAGGGAPATT